MGDGIEPIPGKKELEKALESPEAKEAQREAGIDPNENFENKVASLSSLQREHPDLFGKLTRSFAMQIKSMLQKAMDNASKRHRERRNKGG